MRITGFKLFLSGIVMVMTMSSCCTIISGRTAKVTLEGQVAEPVNIIVDGKGYANVSTFPFKVKVKRNSKPSIILITSNNYVYEDVVVSKKFNPVMWGNLIFGGLIGASVDAMSGSMYSPEDKKYTLAFSPKEVNIDEEGYMRFETLEYDLYARTNERMDYNGVPCAVIRVKVPMSTNYTFEGGIVGNIIYRPGEVILYVPQETKSIVVKNKQYQSSMKYTFPIKVEKQTVYQLTIGD